MAKIEIEIAKRPGWWGVLLVLSHGLRWVYVVFIVAAAAAALGLILGPLVDAAAAPLPLLSRPHLPIELVK